MGKLIVVMLAMMGCMVVLGNEDRNADGSRILEFAYGLDCHLQHFVHDAGIPVGDICSWSW